MKYTKIITHGGAFHADEVVAIALLRKIGVVSKDTPIERIFKVEEKDLKDPSVAILDVGRAFDPKRSCFDHHQDANSPATNVLVLNNFAGSHYSYEVADMVAKTFFNPISDTDRGITKSAFSSFNQIISNFNQLENGFEKALEVAQSILDAVWETAEVAVRGVEDWRRLERLSKRLVFQPKENAFIPNWKELATEEGVTMLITPGREKGDWNLLSRDSDLLKIPASDNQKYLHPSGFMAVYSSLEEAKEAGLELA